MFCFEHIYSLKYWQLLHALPDWLVLFLVWLRMKRFHIHGVVNSITFTLLFFPFLSNDCFHSRKKKRWEAYLILDNCNGVCFGFNDFNVALFITKSTKCKFVATKKKPAKSNEFFKEGVFNYQSQVVNSSLLWRIKTLWKSTVYPVSVIQFLSILDAVISISQMDLKSFSVYQLLLRWCQNEVVWTCLAITLWILP